VVSAGAPIGRIIPAIFGKPSYVGRTQRRVRPAKPVRLGLSLSDNRDLKRQIQEAEAMLTQIDVTRLPSYELGLEKGLKDGLKTKE